MPLRRVRSPGFVRCSGVCHISHCTGNRRVGEFGGSQTRTEPAPYYCTDCGLCSRPHDCRCVLRTIALPVPCARRSVMNASIRLSFVFPDNRRIDPWILAFKDHPQWIRVEDDGASLFSAVDVDAMMADLTRSLMRSFHSPAVSCTMTATTTDKQGTLQAGMERQCMCRPYRRLVPSGGTQRSTA